MLEQGSVSRGVWGLMSEDRKTTGTFLLPVGTVTFLLADVEGSTRQWEADGEAMADAMASLDGVAADAVARHGGVRPIEAEGRPFDPHRHVVVETAPAAAGVPPDTVVREIRRGYLRGEEVLRYAEVVVARQ